MSIEDNACAALIHPLWEFITMSTEHIMVFISLTFLVSASPGPVMLGCLTDGAQVGIYRTSYSMLGASLGNLCLMLVAALGLSLLKTYARVFIALQYLGAAYLAYMGLRLYNTRAHLTPITRTVSASGLFRRALFTALSNPKGIVYFAAIFPPFIDISRALLPQFALLTLIFLSIDWLWMLLYAGCGTALMRYLTTAKQQQRFNRVSGVIFMAMGLLLALGSQQP
jgi:homoserine/homoserine lactone efflux protein